MKQKVKRILIGICILFLSCITFNVYAQNIHVKGKVTDRHGEPTPGAIVAMKGTTTATISDADGAYSLDVPDSKAILVFSLLGYTPQEIVVGARREINVALQEETTDLDEVVVIGYGTAKLKDLTSPIASISGDEINKHITTSAMGGMQGKIPGLQIINSGEPGASPKVRLRGVGSIERDKGEPLYVVDGMFFNNIDFLSNSDIENISVLKDASAAAIYGVRAANGVIIVTTKKGIPNRKPQITYDGFFGLQRPQNLQKMADNVGYSTMIREIASNYEDVGKQNNILNSIHRSIDLYNQSNKDKNGVPETNTNWYKELTKTAPMHSHAISVVGGSEKTSYSVGGSYLNQEGIMNHANTGYERLNLRTRVDVGITNWLKVGGNMVFVNSSQKRGNMSAYEHAYTTPPIMPVFDNKNYHSQDNPNSYASTGALQLQQYFWNPVGIANYRDDIMKRTSVLPSAYAEISLLESKLTFKSSYNQEVSFDHLRRFTPRYAISNSQKEAASELYKGTILNNRWLVDNIITFRDTYDKHSFTAMAGNSMRRDMMQLMNMTANGVPSDKKEYWYIYQGTFKDYSKNVNDVDTWPDDGSEIRGTSFFGRLMYDYDGKYLLSATFRADGTNKTQQHWGYFPSVGLGWVASQEAFMKEQKVFDFLKFRGSWGRLGNDYIDLNRNFKTVSPVTGAFDDVLSHGTTNVAFFTSIKWEEVDEWNVGLDFAMLNNRLTGDIDYYKRTTLNAVFKKPLPLTYSSLNMNNGKIENSGVEVSLNWADRATKDLSYNIGVNLTTLKNAVTYLDKIERIINSGDYSTVRMIGQPIDAFYGYKVDGIYQTQAEIDNDKTIAHLNGDDRPTVGSFKYKDLDGDGQLTDADREVLGSYLPKLYLGGNIGMNYKKWDFGIAFQGQFGHKILNEKRLRRQKQYNMNFDQDLVDNRWTGQGSTNKYPSAKSWDENWNYKFNSFFVENGDTFTIQNIQLGYTFTNIIPSSSNQSSLRLGFTAERPFSFFSYNGFTTEFNQGVDLNPYPMSSTYALTVKLVY